MLLALERVSLAVLIYIALIKIYSLVTVANVNDEIRYDYRVKITSIDYFSSNNE